MVAQRRIAATRSWRAGFSPREASASLPNTGLMKSRAD
jgi:hypothetical protein